MLDIKEIRNNPEEFEKRLKTKEPGISLSTLLSLDEKIRTLQAELESLKHKQNEISKEIGQRKRNKEDASDLLKGMGALSNEISKLQQDISELEKQRTNELAFLPNLPFPDSPVSLDPNDNVCIKEFGEKREFSFPFKSHLELNEEHQLFDFKRTAKTSGAGWPCYIDLGARLEWALIQYMLDSHRKAEYKMIMPPLLVRDEIMFGSAHLPKFENQQFKLQDKDYHLYLIPTAEAVLNGLHYDEILEEEDLPIRYVAYTPCFRREAGAAGEKERGLIRTHQFNKVELFCICKPEDSEAMFEEMLGRAEAIVEGLELHYRNMLLVTSDMSFASSKTVDLEVWLPGQDRYYEVSSISNCTDFQARRSKIRYRKKGEKAALAYTLNGSGVATSRLMVSLLENNQQEDGSITIPKVLHPYLVEELLMPQMVRN